MAISHKEVRMKIQLALVTLAVLVNIPFVAVADNLSPDLIPAGSDVSSLRCSSGLVSVGDLSRDVFDSCGEPYRETRILDEPYRVWVYLTGQSDYVYYMAFLHEKLHRIYRVRCWQDNPDCG